MIAPSIPGFYGKLPSHGDFVTRRLPRQFVEPWDAWLQAGLNASREQLGPDWLDCYLVSPVWQFVLSPGLCGNDAWAGLMMPSVDRVGRYFPLTLATRITDNLALDRFFDDNSDWFDALTDLALSSLDYPFDLQDFDAQLERLPLSSRLSGKTASRPSAAVFSQLVDRLHLCDSLGCSLWRSVMVEQSDVQLMLCDGLPPVDAFVGFLNGDWPQRHRGRIVLCGTPSASVIAVPETERYPEEDVDDCPTLPPKSVTQLRWQSYGLSVVGLRRRLNEDAILDRPEAGLWAVADGMGGHSAGDVASRMLVDALAHVPASSDPDQYCQRVAKCLQAVNGTLVDMAAERGEGAIIGSTVVVLVVIDRQCRYLWAGDSRLYRWRDDILKQLTRDHSLYNESIDQGMEPLDGSHEQGRGNVITRAVGADYELRLDVGRDDVAPGDLFLLCSDGIDKELDHEDIARLCVGDSVEGIVRNLIAEAESRGGRDNISAIAVKLMAP